MTGLQSARLAHYADSVDDAVLDVCAAQVRVPDDTFAMCIGIWPNAHRHQLAMDTYDHDIMYRS